MKSIDKIKKLNKVTKGLEMLNLDREFTSRELKEIFSNKGISFHFLKPYLRVVRTEKFDVKSVEDYQVQVLVDNQGNQVEIDLNNLFGYYYNKDKVVRELSKAFGKELHLEYRTQKIQGTRYFYKVDSQKITNAIARCKNLIEDHIFYLQRQIQCLEYDIEDCQKFLKNA